MKQNFEFPEEQEFLIREFNFSEKHDTDEGVISYSTLYKGGRKLLVSLFPFGYDSSIKVEIIEEGISMVSFTRSNVTSIEFQSWSNEQVIRVYWSNADKECLIYYKPRPRLFYGELV